MATLPYVGFQKPFHKKKKNIPRWPRPAGKKGKGNDEIRDLQSKHDAIEPSSIQTFNDFPLSDYTRKGLKENNYRVPTEIQRESIGLALQGKDILGAAETGSGKTLAFIIPVLEALYCQQWSRYDGMGALIITPTRELAYQIFETLKKVGIHHDFSAGLIIGGKDLHFEKSRMDQCNIVICTPGRILHHMDINPLFECSSMKILVLDEADRCLDMGFEQTMNSIIENLPPKRQTLLFSATQTKSVRDLARLSLKNPSYVAVHEHKKHSTPDGLEQSYIVCDLHEKIGLLWSFIKNHRRQKILIFLSSCKQVKYIYQVFCRLRPGTPLLALYGTLHQLRRMKIYTEFCSKQNVVMFATDIAARGLDFPEVNWVVQLDCPEDATTYIHRAGRTARYSKGGESLLILLPSEEEAMKKELDAMKIPIAKIEVNQQKLMSPVRKIEALLARDPELKADAQRSFVAYVKSVFLMKNKDVFKVEALDLEKYASSLGLAVTPRIRFLKNRSKEVQPTSSKKEEMSSKDSEKGCHEENQEDGSSSDEEQLRQKYSGGDRTAFVLNSDEEDDVIKLKRKDHELDDAGLPPLEEIKMGNKKEKAVLTKAALAKKILKKKIVANSKKIFNDDGDAVSNKGQEKLSEIAIAYENEHEGGGIDIAKAKEIIRAEDKFDKKLFRERVKEKHREAKRKLKGKNKKTDDDYDDEDEEVEVRLGSGSESEGGSEPDTSWIPDPDKFCGKAGGNSGSEESESDREAVVSGKRRKGDMKKNRKKRKVSDDEQEFDTGLTLEQDEEIALRLLQSSR